MKSIAGLIIGIARICLNIKNPSELLEKENEIRLKLEKYYEILNKFELIGDDNEVAKDQVEKIFNQWKNIIKKNNDKTITWRDKKEAYILTEYGRVDSEDNVERIEMLNNMRSVDVESTFDVTTLLAKD